jgi:hypothetical protein
VVAAQRFAADESHHCIDRVRMRFAGPRVGRERAALTGLEVDQESPTVPRLAASVPPRSAKARGHAFRFLGGDLD